MTEKQRAQGRKDRVFDVIVRSYIDTAEPVGSKAVCQRSDLGLSSASIRNVMAELEQQGFIQQPHTSAGRVPTDRGYRYYVDFLMEPEELSAEEIRWIHEELACQRSVEAMAEKASKIISRLTHNAALVYFRNMRRVSFLNYLLEELVEAQKLDQFLEEDDELFVEGIFRMFEQPEFHDTRKWRHLLQAFDEKDDFIHIFSKEERGESDAVRVQIGHENELEDLDDVSVVAKDYFVRETPIGGIAVVGPTRMRYAKIVPLVNHIAGAISRRIQEF